MLFCDCPAQPWSLFVSPAGFQCLRGGWGGHGACTSSDATPPPPPSATIIFLQWSQVMAYGQPVTTRALACGVPWGPGARWALSGLAGVRMGLCPEQSSPVHVL